MNTRRNRGARAALLTLEDDAAIARGGFGCIFSTSDEYERALIAERRARGCYSRSYGAWPIALFIGCALAVAASGLVFR